MDDDRSECAYRLGFANGVLHVDGKPHVQGQELRTAGWNTTGGTLLVTRDGYLGMLGVALIVGPVVGKSRLSTRTIERHRENGTFIVEPRQSPGRRNRCEYPPDAVLKYMRSLARRRARVHGTEVAQDRRLTRRAALAARGSSRRRGLASGPSADEQARIGAMLEAGTPTSIIMRSVGVGNEDILATIDGIEEVKRRWASSRKGFVVNAEQREQLKNLGYDVASADELIDAAKQHAMLTQGYKRRLLSQSRTQDDDGQQKQEPVDKMV